MVSREFLEQYAAITSNLRSLERRKKYYEDHPLLQEHGVVRGSMVDFPFTETHIVVSGTSVNAKSAEQRKAEINQNLVDIEVNRLVLEDMKLEIERFINKSVRGAENKAIFRLHFIDGRTLQQIGDELHMDKSTVSRRIDNVLAEQQAREWYKNNRPSKLDEMSGISRFID